MGTSIRSRAMTGEPIRGVSASIRAPDRLSGDQGSDDHTSGNLRATNDQRADQESYSGDQSTGQTIKWSILSDKFNTVWHNGTFKPHTLCQKNVYGENNFLPVGTWHSKSI